MSTSSLIELGVRRTGKPTDDSLLKLWVRKEDRGPEYRTAKAKPNSRWHKQRALTASVASAWFTTAFHAGLSLHDQPEDIETLKLLQQAWHELDDAGRQAVTERYEQAAKLFPTLSSEERPRSLVRQAMTRIGELSKIRLTHLSVHIEKGTALVVGLVAGQPSQITENRLDSLRDKISEVVGMPVVHGFRVIPETIFSSTRDDT